MKKLIMVIIIIGLLLLMGGCQPKSKIDRCRLEFLNDTRTFIELIEGDLKDDKIDPFWLNQGREGGKYFLEYLNQELSDQEEKIFNDLLQSFSLITFDENKENNIERFTEEIKKIKKIIM